jgi:heptosyltransferase-1
VTGDTGPMHMAVALAVPVVALFGPTSPVKFGPFTTLKTLLRLEEPCRKCPQPCLHAITVEECVEAALGLFRDTAYPVRRVRTDPRSG